MIGGATRFCGGLALADATSRPAESRPRGSNENVGADRSRFAPQVVTNRSCPAVYRVVAIAFRRRAAGCGATGTPDVLRRCGDRRIRTEVDALPAALGLKAAQA